MKIIDEELYNDFIESRAVKSFSKDQLHLLATFASISPFTKRWLGKLEIEPILKKYHTFSKDEIAKEISNLLNCGEEALFIKKIRQLKYVELIKIVIRDVYGINTIEKTLDELTLLADMIISACCFFVERGYKKNVPTLSVIAMGKLGAMELNFSSDVDLVYVYEASELEEVEDLNKKAVLINKLLTTTTEDGFLYRVDNDLRPGGRFSPLAMSGEAVKDHYLLFGEAWQRIALLRARFLAGDEKFVAELLDELAPFVYSKYLDFSLVDELRRLKEKINAESLKKDKEGINIKLGKGGIREAEFFVQVLQIINGGKDVNLRKVKFSEAVDALAFKQIIDQWDAKNLKDAYYFLRRVENSIQMEEERQEYLLPKDEKILKRVITRCGFGSIEDFMNRLEFYRNIVSNHFKSLFEEKIKVKGDEISKENILNLVKIKCGDEGDITGVVEKFYDLRESVPTRYKENFVKFIFELTNKISERSNYKKIFKVIEDFVHLIVKRPVYIPLLAENPLIIDKVLDILSLGSFFSMILLTHPESLDFFISQRDNLDRGNFCDYLKTVKNLVAGAVEFEDKMYLLRQFKNSEWLKIALLKYSEAIDNSTMELFLSNLAEAILVTVVEIWEEALNKKYEKPKEEFALIGLGKLGTKEMNFHSDLDLIFIYQSDDEKAAFYNTKLLQRVITALTVTTKEGYLYKVDMRLRPTGSQGPLVTTFENFENYHKESAWVFEKQALTKARVLGERDVFKEKIETLIEKIVYENNYEEQYLKTEIKKMRKKIEEEISSKQKGLIDIKTGKGGLVDIEFIVQYIKLSHGKKHKELREVNTEEFLKVLKNFEILSLSEVDELLKSYIFLKSLETNLRINAGYSKDSLNLEEIDEEVIKFLLSGYNATFTKDLKDKNDKSQLSKIVGDINQSSNKKLKTEFLKKVKKTLRDVSEIYSRIFV